MPNRRTTGKDIGAAGGSAPRPRRKSEPATRSNRSAAQSAAALDGWTEPGAEQLIAGAATDLKHSADEIERLAYSFWEARGYQGGSPEADWFRAEQELRERTAVTATVA